MYFSPENRRKRVRMRREAARILAAAGWELSAVAAVLGVSKPLLYQEGVRAKKNKLQGRAERMTELAATGKSMTEIGLEFGLSRERVRQVFVKEGISTTGWRAIAKGHRGLLQTEARNRFLDARCFKTYGVERAELIRLNDGFTPKDTRSHSHRWMRQKYSAAYRSIEWKLSFPEWCAIWEASGKWALCGRGRGLYCMARYKDAGAYEVGNVRICLNEENISESYESSPYEGRRALNQFESLVAKREMQVLALSKLGKRPREIAVDLALSRTYVGQLLSRARRKERETAQIVVAES